MLKIYSINCMKFWVELGHAEWLKNEIEEKGQRMRSVSLYFYAYTLGHSESILIKWIP